MRDVVCWSHEGLQSKTNKMLGFIKLGYMITDTQNRLVGAKGEEVRRDGISKCKLLYIDWITRSYSIAQEAIFSIL